MEERFKFSFPEGKIYLIFIFVLSAIIFYYDRAIGTLAAVLLLYLFYYNFRTVKTKSNTLMTELKNLSIDMDVATKQTMLEFPVALAIVDQNGFILWHNMAMADLFDFQNMIDKNIAIFIRGHNFAQVIPDENEEKKVIEDFELQNSSYDLHSILLRDENHQKKRYALYFFDKSRQKNLEDMYINVKPAIMQIQIDSYEEVLNSTPVEMRGMLMTQIDGRLRSWIDSASGILTRYADDRYVSYVTEKQLNEFEENKFSILDDLREIELSNTIPVTASIGVSDFETSLSETNKNATSSLELALGRGGDQAVSRRGEKTFFYGGKSKAVEKQTRVRARIVGQALRDLILSYDEVLIMGHANPDMDALGSAIGIANICKILGRDFNIILEKPNPSIELMYEDIMNDGTFMDTFIGHDQARKALKNSDILLIVVDTHKPSLTEYPDALELAHKIAFIDHHRRGVEYIENAALSYHETYASSASEMISELVQYVKESAIIEKITANCLLAGITLDTKNFTKKTGVRTFEAAAYLRKNQANILTVKKYFQGDYEGFIIKAKAIKNVELYHNSIAITYCEDVMETPSLMAAQIADELMEIKGVKASFVVAEGRDGVKHISARSLEEINVQIIAEILGGGGHLDTAGAQLSNVSIEEAIEKVKLAIDEYFDENDESKREA